MVRVELIVVRAIEGPHDHEYGHRRSRSCECLCALVGTLNVFARTGHLHVVDGFVSLTEERRSFVDILDSDGLVRDVFNDEIFTDGYEPGPWISDKRNSA